MSIPPKNVLGRVIYRGPRGGLFVKNTRTNKKIYSFVATNSEKARAKASYTPVSRTAPAPDTPLNIPPGYSKTPYVINRGSKNKLYKKDSSGRYYLTKINANGKRRLHGTYAKYRYVINSRTGVNNRLEEHLRREKGKAPVTTTVGTPIVGYTKTSYTDMNGRSIYKKNSSGRYYVALKFRDGTARILHSVSKSESVTNRTTGITNTIAGHTRRPLAATAAPPRVRNISSEKLPTPSPRVVITTAERNRRLAEIRARLNALRAKRIAEMPKKRKNIENKLRLAYWRTRARVSTTRDSLQGVPTKTISFDLCHAPATVPRTPCKIRDINLEVYTGSNPLIDSGGVVAMQEKDFDPEWFKRQNMYISKLSDYDFWTVQAHTNRSHTWIGPYTYKGIIPRFDELGDSDEHIRPLWPQIRKMILNGTYPDTEKWVKDFKNTVNEYERYNLYSRNIMKLPDAVKKTALEMYKKDLKRIIAGAPKSKKKMILYRGSYFDIFKGTTGHWHKLKSFCSAAYNIKHASDYGSSFTRVTVLPGTPVLLVAGTNQWNYAGEYEVMVNIDTQYLIRSRRVKRHVYYQKRRLDYGNFTVTDVTITK